MLPFESDTSRRILSCNSNSLSFKTALICANTELALPDIQLDLKVVAYLIKISQMSCDSTIRLYNTSSQTIPRYALVYGDTIMITNYAPTKFDPKLNEILSVLPELTVINYVSTKNKLNVLTDVTYAMGSMTFTSDGNTLTAKLKLSNGSEYPSEIELLSPLTIPAGTSIKVNTKTLLTTLNALDPTLPVSIGYKDGFLYLVNDLVKISLTSIGGK